MRKELRLSVLSLAAILGACTGKREQTATGLDVRKKADVDLSTTPRNYTRMRFVSPIEQSSAGAHALVPVRSPRVARVATVHHAVAVANTDVAAVLASHQLTPVSTASTALVVEPSMPVAMHLAAEPAPMAGMSSSDMMDHAGEAEHHPAIGNVVIRGGLMGGAKKCDPRTDTHTTPQELGRPDFAMPAATGRPVFGRQR
ncbi:MAG: hypothetical protein JWM95_3828 [Gemmatimonadetes bacterium]|nr:hypothetical protein [Gemmatimonadota bacterium]